MPTYDYVCQNGHEFEVFQRISEEPVDECPDCGGTAQRRISGGAGFLFKGEGFYITDYRSDDYKQKASSESPGAKEGKASETKSPDAKAGGGSTAADSDS